MGQCGMVRGYGSRGTRGLQVLEYHTISEASNVFVAIA